MSRPNGAVCGRLYAVPSTCQRCDCRPCRQVANVTKALGGAEMTRVQQKALPPVLAGGDCLVRSQTGSGKTLAYLLPVIQVSHGSHGHLRTVIRS